MSLLGDRQKKYEKRRSRKNRSATVVKPMKRFIGFLLTLAILGGVVGLCYLAWPWIEQWWCTVSDTIE